MTSRLLPFRLPLQWIVALAVAALILLPFDLVAGTRLTGWDWRLVLIGLVAVNLLPFAGQAICLALAVFGAYQLGQDHGALRISNTDTAQVVSQAATPTTAPAATPAAPAKPTTDFATWRRTVAAPSIQDNCLEKGQAKGLVDSRQIEHIARVCACYGAAAVNIITEADVADGGVQATPEFNARLSDEARRICQTSK